jgi:hypothetical protein
MQVGATTKHYHFLPLHIYGTFSLAIGSCQIACPNLKTVQLKVNITATMLILMLI